MIEERIYPTYKIATLNQALVQQGVSADKLLEGTALQSDEILSNSTRISKQQLIQIYRNAVAVTQDSAIGLQVGQRLGMTNYGIYGYALISSATLRTTLQSGAGPACCRLPLLAYSIATQGLPAKS